MTTKQKKRKYMKPAMQVYDLQSPSKLLAGSGDGGMNPAGPYTPGGDPLYP